jgi:hypothetical protein
MKKTYHGSCHCGAVKFEADLDLAEGTGKCNCSSCTKTRAWGARGKPADLRVLAGEDQLSDYQHGPKLSHFLFCQTCGCRPFARGDIAEMGGEYVSVFLASLDDIDPAELAQTPVTYMDGRNNNWWHPPAQTNYL